jgi:penicillin-binding protein 1A
LGCSKFSLYNPVRNPVGVKKTECGTCSDGERKYYYGKKRETSKFTITLDFKLESHREGSATYFRDLRDYMKNGLMKTRSRRI